MKNLILSLPFSICLIIVVFLFMLFLLASRFFVGVLIDEGIKKHKLFLSVIGVLAIIFVTFGILIITWRL